MVKNARNFGFLDGRVVFVDVAYRLQERCHKFFACLEVCAAALRLSLASPRPLPAPKAERLVREHVSPESYFF
jgi:hypothetical protein